MNRFMRLNNISTENKPKLTLTMAMSESEIPLMLYSEKANEVDTYTAVRSSVSPYGYFSHVITQYFFVAISNKCINNIL